MAISKSIVLALALTSSFCFADEKLGHAVYFGNPDNLRPAQSLSFDAYNLIGGFLDQEACPSPATVTVWLATNGSESCHFGSEGQALAYARSRGTVQRKEIPILSVTTNPTRSP